MSKVYSFVGNEPAPIELLQKFKEDRNLSDADMTQFGISLLPVSLIEAELGWREPNPMFQISYWGIHGEKLLDARGSQLRRFRRTVLNAQGERYTQRRGSGALHYLPRDRVWETVAHDPTVAIFYTEGELKAISSHKHFGPTVGNAGVSSWRGPHGLAAPLNEFEWKGRPVFVIYDADSVSTSNVPLKPTVVRALSELACDLMVRGAKVKQLNIAQTKHFKEGEKCGVDDYIKKGGTLEELMATASDPVIDQDLARMFDRYAVFTGTKPHILDIRDGRTFNAKEFELFIETQTRLRDGKPVKLATLYREHTDRNVVESYVFDPSNDPGYLPSEKKYNTWRGFATQPRQSVDYDRHIGLFVKFQSGVWGADNCGFYFSWLAHLFQRPAELTTISPILVSRVKGIGKSLTGGFVRDLIGRTGSTVASVESLTDKFTAELEGRIFIQVDEADGLFSGRENRLKALDGDTIRIRKMNTDGYVVPNILRKFYTTNENAAFRIASDERRYWVIRSPLGREDGLEDSEWSRFLRSEIVPLRHNPEFLSDLMWFFQHYDISEWDPGAPVPRTEAMIDMVEAGETKKGTIAREVYSELTESEEWFCRTAAMRSEDAKLWGEITSIHKDEKGRTVAHVAKIQGKLVSLSVYLTRACKLQIEEDASRGAKIAPGQITGDDVQRMLLNVKNKINEKNMVIGADKF